MGFKDLGAGGIACASVELADRIIALPEGVDSSEGLQRGDPGRNDKYGYFLASISIRVSKKPTTCWEQ